MLEFIENLLNGDAVQFLPLGEVMLNIRTGLNPRKNFKLNTEDANNFYITVRELNGLHLNITEATNKVNDEALALISKRSMLQVGDILFSGTGTIGRTHLITETPHKWNIKEGIYAITPNNDIVTSKYLFRVLESEVVELQIKALAMGGTVQSVSMANLKSIVIPIPPMRVQEEIVRILDMFSELTAELTAELSLRQKQYEYYREKLLTFTNDTAEFVALSEVATIYGGLSGKRKEDFENGNAYYITYKNIFSNISVDLNILEKVQISEGEKQHKVKKGDVLFTGSSENLEDVAISSVITKNFEEDIYLNSFSFGLRFNDNIAILPDFAKFLFRSEHIRRQLKKTANGVTRYNVSKEKINRVIIPIPPIAEQERIVAILDKFDILVNSISEGLPAEINLRQKQYEYYRNALLSFE